MGFFNSKKKIGISDSQSQIAERIASGLLSSQRKLADRINSRFRELSVHVQMSLLFTLGVAFGIYCGYLLLRAFI
jgi:hypothetical protein